MLKIRLRRMGSTHRPFYRVVVSDSRRTPTASAVEEIGYYDPGKKPAVVKIETDRVEYWTSHGAQLSGAVKKLVKQQAKGIVGTFSSATTEAVKTEAATAETTPAAEEKAEPATAESTETASEASAESKPEQASEKAAPAEEAEKGAGTEAETTEATSA